MPTFSVDSETVKSCFIHLKIRRRFAQINDTLRISTFCKWQDSIAIKRPSLYLNPITFYWKTQPCPDKDRMHRVVLSEGIVDP